MHTAIMDGSEQVGTEDSIVFKPSPWPVIGSYVVFPIIMSLVLSTAVNETIATISVIVFFVFFFGAFRSDVFFVRSMNALGHINSVTLGPDGVLHRSWKFWLFFSGPKTYQYRWDEIHSIRLHKASYNYKMIAFTPAKAEVGKFYRSHIDGTYGVPRYGRGSSMLEAMLAYHRRYSDRA